MSRNILHCDMNNFYASVECMLNPEISRFPVAVCGETEQRHGIVLAKNYHARSFGIKTGDTVWQAKNKAPGLVVVHPHFDEYMKYSALAREIYCRYSDRVESFGPDECWIDVTGTEKIFGTPVQAANEIREKIKAELGLTVSVGVSFNKVFAKLGSDIKKPDAVTEITKSNFKSTVWNLPASAMLGVGRSTVKTLNSHGIFTIGDIAKSDKDWIAYALGKNGISLREHANGNDSSPVMPCDYIRPVQSISRGITTAADLTEPHQVWCVILELSQVISHQLREHGKKAGSVAIQIKNSSLITKQAQAAIERPTQSPMAIAKAAFDIFNSTYGWENNVRSVTVYAISLEDKNTPFQTDIFSDFKKEEKLERLDNCIETIRDKFGKNAIKNAVLLNNSVMHELKPGFSAPNHNNFLKA